MTSRPPLRNARATAAALVLAAAFLAVACSRSPESASSVTRTIEIPAEKLAEIRANPHVKKATRGSDPTARLGGLGKDPWPPGILILTIDPYLEEIGLGLGMTLAEIDGKKTVEIFGSRWKNLRGDASAFRREHYRDLVNYLFVENKRDGFVLTMYLDVPTDEAQLPGYKPKVERWRVKFK